MTNKKDNPTKRGAKPYYTGSRQELLEGFLERYISLKGQNRNQFWFDVYSEWWKKFPWKLNDKEEPPLDNPEEMKALGSTTESERKDRATVEDAVKQRIKNWFAYHSQNRISRVDGEWSRILQRLHEHSNPKPRKRSVVQQFMLENTALVDAAFVSAHGEGRGMDGTEYMNRRHDLAKRMVHGEHKDQISALEKRAQDHHEQEVRQWALALDNIKQAPDVNAARDSLFSAVHTLLRVVGTYTGCYVTLLAAAVPSVGSGEKDYFSAVHHVPEGKASQLNWTEWDSDGFRLNVARQFKKYIKFMESTTDTADCTSNPPGGRLTSTTPTVATPSATARSLPSLQPRSTSNQTKTAMKRTAAGKYKAAKAVYTEPGDSDGWSDGSSAPGLQNKRQRTIITRSQSKTSGGEISDPADDNASAIISPPINAPIALNPPSTTTTPELIPNQSAPSPDEPAPPMETPSVNESESPSDAQGVNEPALRADTPSEDPASTPDVESRSTSDALEDTGVCSSPSSGGANSFAPATSTPTTDPPAASNTQPTISPAMSNKGTLEVTPLPASTTIPKFLATTQKKNKTSVYSYLSASRDPRFLSLLQAYISFENAAAGQSGSLSTTKRPTQIAWWIRSARIDAVPPWTNLQDYGTSVIDWWSTLQPSWRTLECGENAREEGSLDCLCQPGINGLLNVVILAYWWGNGLGKSSTGSHSEEERYSWFTNDVSWVLLTLAKSVLLPS